MLSLKYAVAPRPWSSLVVKGLWIGAWEARTEAKELGFTTVFSLLTGAERDSIDYPWQLPAGVVEHKYEIDDVAGAVLAPVLADALPKIHEVRARGGVALVHCGAGISRSPSVALAYLIKYLGIPYSDAHDRLVIARPVVCPKVGFVAQLRDLAVDTVAMPVLAAPDAVPKPPLTDKEIEEFFDVLDLAAEEAFADAIEVDNEVSVYSASATAS
jgi:hypothetical protein